MPHDDALVDLLARSGAHATRDVVAPDSWATTICLHAARQRRRRIGITTGAVATVAAAGIAFAVTGPLTRTDHSTATRLAAFSIAADSPDARAATQRLSCLTSAPPAPGGSTSVLSLGGADTDGSPCDLLNGRHDTTLPDDAQAVPEHHNHLYLGTRTAGYRLGYRTFSDNPGDPLVLQIAVAGTVTTHDLLAILDEVRLVPVGR